MQNACNALRIGNASSLRRQNIQQCNGFETGTSSPVKLYRLVN